jgi:uncharacterized membrane protein
MGPVDLAPAAPWAAAALLLAALGASVALYADLPATMPTHWDANGNVNGTMPKQVGAFLLPAIGAVVLGLLLALPRIDPLRANYARFARAYQGFALALAGFLVGLHALVLAAALGGGPPFLPGLLVLLAGLFAILAAFVGRVPPTWFVGIRTPWTLSNEATWRATHRLAAKLFLALALATLAAAALPPAWAFRVVGGGAALVAAVCVVYSLVDYRKRTRAPS